MMARQKRHTLPADTFKVVMYASCGMSVPVAEGLSELDALQTVLRYVDRRVKRGYQATELGVGEYELTEPEDSAMVPDDAGIIKAKRETVPAYECWNCGDIVRMGHDCSCQERTDADEAVD